MIPSPDLEVKQSEMQARSQKRRSKQNRNNAKGPRRKENLPILRGTRRSLKDLLRDWIANPESPARHVSYWMCCIDKLERKEPIPTFKEFYDYLNTQEDKETDEPTGTFTIREPVSRCEQSPAIERETASLA
jgi:hypothetical protein